MALLAGGTNIGNLTGNGGLAAAFDGTTNQTGAASAGRTMATNAYVGKTLSTRVARLTVYGSNDSGYASGINPTVTLYLYGKTGSAPASGTDGTILGQVSFTDTANESGNPRNISSSDTTTTFDHFWMYVSHNGVANNIRVAETLFYSPDLYTLTADLGTYALTGITALFATGKNMIASAGSFALTGVSAAARYSMAASADAFTLTGVDAVLLRGRRLVAEVAEFSVTGFAAELSGRIFSWGAKFVRPASASKLGRPASAGGSIRRPTTGPVLKRDN